MDASEVTEGAQVRLKRVVPLFAVLVLVTFVPHGHLPARSVFVDAAVIETAPGCFVCQIVIRTRPGNDILALQELTIEDSGKAALDWYEREGRALIKYRLSCEVKAGQEWAAVSLKIDGKKSNSSFQWGGRNRVRVERLGR